MSARFFLTAAALVLGGFASTSAQGESPADASGLLRDAGAAPVWQGEMGHAQIRMRMVEFDGGALDGVLNGRAGDVALNLFADTTVLATTEKLERGDGGDYTWRGRIDGNGSYAVLVRRGTETAGMVRTLDGVYEIIPSGNGVSRVAEVHVAALAPCGIDEHEHAAMLAANPLAGGDFEAALERTIEAEEEALASGATARGDVVPTLDQLVAYTPRALSWIGGSEAGMFAFIDMAIEDMNSVLDNNGINMQTRVVFKHPLNENETGGGATDRNAFRIDGDGKWDEIAQLRDDFGADICHILVRDSDVCGIAAMIYRRAANSADFAYCLTAMSCVSNFTFTHEVGHLIGGAHDLVNAGGQAGAGTFSYSFGWRDPVDATWRTIMAYAPGSRVNYFSTPDVTWTDGLPLGDAAAADNSRTIELNVDLITAWRASVGLAPTGLTADVRAASIDLDWNPVAQAVLYQVWRGPSANVQQAQFRGATANTEFTDSSVNPGSTYYYYTKAQFADGGISGFSDPVVATASSALGPDLSGDGSVNSVDLAILLAAWGTSGADFSGDGNTNSVDLAILLAAWG